MKKHSSITVHTYSLAQLLTQGRSDFSSIRIFNEYKKEKIYQLRNQHLSQVLNISISNQNFNKTQHGKPYLPNYQNLSFNHSHSQQNYALAISQEIADLGVDIEDLSRKVRFEALANHAFHPNEFAYWETVDFAKEYWFKVWTTKEAVLKASGLGIRINLNELDTQVHPESNSGSCFHPQIGYFTFQNFNLGHIVLTVAWRSNDSSHCLQFPNIQIIQH